MQTMKVQSPSYSLFMNTTIIFSLLEDISRNVCYFKCPLALSWTTKCQQLYMGASSQRLYILWHPQEKRQDVGQVFFIHQPL